MRRLLLRLYPKTWRNRHEDEFRALLDDYPMRWWVVADVIRQAAVEQRRAHPAGFRALAAALAFAVADAIAVAYGITDNILWAPTTPVRALWLWVTVAPLIVAALPVVRERLGSRR
jgi:hypothetical protein